MANQKAWIKTTLVELDPNMGLEPDFKGHNVDSYATIIAQGSDVLLVVCANNGQLGLLMQEDGVSVWINDGDEEIIVNVIAEAQAMGSDESTVRSTDVACDVSADEPVQPEANVGAVERKPKK